MGISVDGKRLYRIGDALGRAGICRATYFRWVSQGRIPDARFRDRNGRRVLTEDELQILVREATRIVEASPQLIIPLEAAGD